MSKHEKRILAFELFLYNKLITLQTYTTKEIEVYLNVSRPTIYRLLKEIRESAYFETLTKAGLDSIAKQKVDIKEK